MARPKRYPHTICVRLDDAQAEVLSELVQRMQEDQPATRGDVIRSFLDDARLQTSS